MAMMLPDELVWIMQKLGFEWPDIDEDEVRRGAQIVRTFGTDLEDCIQAVDRKVNGDLTASMRGEAGPAYVNAWNLNRSQNLQQLVDFMGPASEGMDIAADLVFALKVKVIAEVTITMAQLIPLLAAGPFGAAGAAALVMVKKRLLGAAIDIAVEQVLNQVLPMVVEPLAEHAPAVIDAILDAPLVEATVGDSDEFYADLQALEQAESDMEIHATDVQTVVQTFLADITSLDLGGDA